MQASGILTRSLTVLTSDKLDFLSGGESEARIKGDKGSQGFLGNGRTRKRG